jgi:hypothetical protein
MFFKKTALLVDTRLQQQQTFIFHTQPQYPLYTVVANITNDVMQEERRSVLNYCNVTISPLND